MKLPNGYGSIYKLSGKRRKPWCVRITSGWDVDPETRKVIQIRSILGTYETKQEALTALSDYNKDPYDLHINTMTFAELYDKWSDKHFQKVSQSNINGCKASFNLCDSIKGMKVQDIKLAHLQKIVDESGKNTPTLKKLKIMFGLMYDYAVRNEILPPDKREMIKFLDISQAGNPNALNRKPFSRKEIDKLWEMVGGNDRFQIPLILIYTGLRIGEFWNLKKEDVHLEERWFQVTESKTESGIREVPIAEKIVPFFEHWMNNSDSIYVFPTSKGTKHTDRNFRDSWWNPMMDELGIDHRPHDTRHTCVSLLTTAGVDDRIIKKVVGHKGQGVTESVYTHLELPIKLEAINKI